MGYSKRHKSMRYSKKELIQERLLFRLFTYLFYTSYLDSATPYSLSRKFLFTKHKIHFYLLKTLLYLRPYHVNDFLIIFCGFSKCTRIYNQWFILLWTCYLITSQSRPSLTNVGQMYLYVLRRHQPNLPNFQLGQFSGVKQTTRISED